MGWRGEVGGRSVWKNRIHLFSHLFICHSPLCLRSCVKGLGAPSGYKQSLKALNARQRNSEFLQKPKEPLKLWSGRGRMGLVG